MCVKWSVAFRSFALAPNTSEAEPPTNPSTKKRHGLMFGERASIDVISRRTLFMLAKVKFFLIKFTYQLSQVQTDCFLRRWCSCRRFIDGHTLDCNFGSVISWAACALFTCFAFFFYLIPLAENRKGQLLAISNQPRPMCVVTMCKGVDTNDVSFSGHIVSHLANCFARQNTQVN